MKNSFNVQTYVDARMLAGVLSAIHEIGYIPRSASDLIRIVLSGFYETHVVSGKGGQLFASTEEAVDYLDRSGISTRQMGDNRRSAGTKVQIKVEAKAPNARLDEKQSRRAQEIFNSINDEQVATDDNDIATALQRMLQGKEKGE